MDNDSNEEIQLMDNVEILQSQLAAAGRPVVRAIIMNHFMLILASDNPTERIMK